MAYTLEAFCRDCRAALKSDVSRAGREQVRSLLEALLADKDFIARHVAAMPPGRHTRFISPSTASGSRK